MNRGADSVFFDGLLRSKIIAGGEYRGFPDMLGDACNSHGTACNSHSIGDLRSATSCVSFRLRFAMVGPGEFLIAARSDALRAPVSRFVGLGETLMHGDAFGETLVRL